MKIFFPSFFSYFFSPTRNKYLLIGGLLLLLGFILLPFIFGLPILIAGAIFISLGTLLSLVEKIPGGKFLVEKYQKLFRQMSAFFELLKKQAKPKLKNK